MGSVFVARFTSKAPLIFYVVLTWRNRVYVRWEVGFTPKEVGAFIRKRIAEEESKELEKQHVNIRDWPAGGA